MLRDEQWPHVKNILTKHDRIEVKKGKPMHGRPAALMRVKRPIELLDYTLPETLKIIEDIINENT
jgi:hypothetical protein